MVYACCVHVCVVFFASLRACAHSVYAPVFHMVLCFCVHIFEQGGREGWCLIRLRHRPLRACPMSAIPFTRRG